MTGCAGTADGEDLSFTGSEVPRTDSPTMHRTEWVDESDTTTMKDPGGAGIGLPYTFRVSSVKKAHIDYYIYDSGVRTLLSTAGNFAVVVTATEIVGRQTIGFG